MTLKLYFHPLSSFSMKAVMAFYENDTPFEPVILDFTNEASRAALLNIWPIGKFPVLRDETRGRTIPELSIIIEYLAQHYPGRTELIPADADLARQARYHDRFFDLYIDMQMQKVVGDRLRPQGQRDPLGVDQALAQLKAALDLIDGYMKTRTWVMGDAFGMADCAAAPALYYADLVLPFRATHSNVARYFDRLLARPSFARCLKEAEPYRHMFPKG